MKRTASDVNSLWGGIHLHRGYYCPSPIQDVIAANVKRGKILKRLTKRSNPDCEFWFDDRERLIFANSSFGNESILRDGSKEIGIVFDEDGIQYMSECEYEKERIKKYILAECSFSYPKQVQFITMEVYTYAEDTFVTDVYRWIRPTCDNVKLSKELSKISGHTPATWYDHNKIIFTLQDGRLSEYTVLQYDGECPRESACNDMTYQVYVDRKV